MAKGKPEGERKACVADIRRMLASGLSKSAALTKAAKSWDVSVSVAFRWLRAADAAALSSVLPLITVRQISAPRFGTTMTGQQLVAAVLRGRKASKVTVTARPAIAGHPPIVLNPDTVIELEWEE